MAKYYPFYQVENLWTKKQRGAMIIIGMDLSVLQSRIERRERNWMSSFARINQHKQQNSVKTIMHSPSQFDKVTYNKFRLHNKKKRKIEKETKECTHV